MSCCPCCSQKEYLECCEVFITYKQLPATPEALMRSRFTAYSQANIDYIVTTMKGLASMNFNADTSRKWAQMAKWLELQIVKAPSVLPHEKTGYVEFIAHYLLANKKYIIHEISEFYLENDRWYYVDGKPGELATKLNKTKIGRNDLCPCGSHKKYKNCCVI